MKVESQLTRTTRVTTRVEVIVMGTLEEAMEHATDLALDYVSETMMVDILKLDGNKYAIGIDYGRYADTTTEPA